MILDSGLLFLGHPVLLLLFIINFVLHVIQIDEKVKTKNNNKIARKS